MAVMQPDLTDMLIEKKPSEKDSQAYNKWTVDIERAAMLNVSDHDISRDISSCARYLNVGLNVLFEEFACILRLTNLLEPIIPLGIDTALPENSLFIILANMAVCLVTVQNYYTLRTYCDMFDIKSVMEIY